MVDSNLGFYSRVAQQDCSDRGRIPPPATLSGRHAVAVGGARGEPVSVSVTYAVPVRLPLAGWVFPSAVDIHAIATMRREYA